MLLAMKGVSRNYLTGEGAVPVLRGVDLSVGEGETVALTGESGSGKSTLLHLAAGLDRADGGQVMLQGRDLGTLADAELAALRRNVVGLVFQQFNLVPSLDVAANLALHARLAGRFEPDRVQVLARALGLDAILSRYPEQLSGGQQQRVAIGRTLAARPALVLADEPTGNLDEATGDAVIDVMLRLVTETGAALLLVTHSGRLAARMGRRLHLAGGRLAPC